MSDDVIVVIDSSPAPVNVTVAEATPINVISTIPGTAGPQGEAGASGDAAATLEHEQAIAEREWIIIHSLGYRPNVHVVDDIGQTIWPDIEYVSDTEIHINHGDPYAGFAYLS